MSRVGRVVRNSLLLGLQQVAVNLLSVVVVGYIARKLGQTDYGVFSLAFTFTVSFAFLGHLGLRTLTIREVAKERENAQEYLGKIIPARLILITLMTAAIPLAAICLQYDSKTVIIVSIAAVSALFEQLSRIFADIFQAHEEMGKVAFRDIAVRVFTGLASIAVLYFGHRLVAVSWIYVLGAVVGLLINMLLYNHRFAWPKLQFDLPFIWNNIKEGLVFMVLGMASTLYAHIDVFIISKLLDMQSVGIYNASANLFYRLCVIADAVGTASFPAIAQLYWQNKSEASNILTKSLCGMLIVSVPIALGGWMLADDIITMIYGTGYALSADVFKILIISSPFMFFSLLMNYALGAIKMQGTVLKIILILLVLNTIINIGIIPIYGVIGSAAVTFATECLGFFVLLAIALKYFHIFDVFGSIKIILIPLCGMVLAVNFTDEFGPIIAILSGAFSYSIIILILYKNIVVDYFVHTNKIGK